MVGHLVGSLVRRGVEVAHEHSKKPDAEKILHEIPTWGIVALLTTVLSYAFVTFTLEYTIRLVIGHLALVEHPETELEVHEYVPASKEDAKIAQNLVDCGLIDEEAITQPSVTVKSKPLTSSIRRTKRHICTIGGSEKSKYRGIGIFALYSVFTGVFSGLLGMTIPLPVAEVVAAVVASRIHCAWTHKIITMPSDKKLKERVVSRAQWRELVVPTIISSSATTVCLGAIVFVFAATSRWASDLHVQGAPGWTTLAIMLPINLTLAPVLAVFVMLPAYAQLVRKELSLLAPEEETIVTTDRTFGGRIQHIGQKLGVKDAWNSFSWEATRRMIKLYVKFFFIMVAVSFFFIHIFALQAYLLVGDDLKDVLKGLKDHADL